MMSEQLRESLSALVDGEASEEDVQRVLDNLDDASVRQTWCRYQAAHSSLSADSAESLFDMDISSQVMAAIADEPEFSVSASTPIEALAPDPSPTIKPVARWRQFLAPAASAAVAASVFAAVMLTSQYLGGLPGSTSAGGDIVASAGGAAGANGVTGVNGVMEGSDTVEGLERFPRSAVVNAPGGGAAVLADFSTGVVSTAEPVADYDAIARERLRRYMLPHAEEAALNAPQGMMPFARVATFRTGD